ncbi:hypothetical protein [Tatumella sp. UCD-D_suzukii]|uniref:hypothetical protein n=1 Tax=Tatumella sp. UCD-D_suzukii TaxID=1408192 RepID=UPI00047100EF|nr:hypothetical protein [Tatumella sp. UCD-D_suzukii]
MPVKIKGSSFGSSVKGTLFLGNADDTEIENCQFGDTQGRHVVIVNKPRGKGDDYNGVGLSRDTPSEELTKIKELLLQSGVNVKDEKAVKKVFESSKFDRWVANGANICTIAGFIIAEMFTKK